VVNRFINLKVTYIIAALITGLRLVKTSQLPTSLPALAAEMKSVKVGAGEMRSTVDRTLQGNVRSLYRVD